MSVALRPAPPQQPDWYDPVLLERVRAELAACPPLVGADECARLAGALARVARREAVVLQGGDCAELFAEAGAAHTGRKLALLYGLAGRLRARTGAEVVTIGRMAGQYAKPRSRPWQRLAGGGSLPVYRGDAVNGAEPDRDRRVADPSRLLTAYDSARTVLGAVRASWRARPDAERAHVSHEALLLDYEEPLVREAGASWYAGSAHSLWVGDRTRAADGAHVAFAGSVANPVGVKLGPGVTPPEAVRLSRVLNPEGAEGRLAFIVRLGSERIRCLLPEIVGEVVRRGAPVVWLCDPMHGNTRQVRGDRKTRPMEAIVEEVTAFAHVLRFLGQWPGGLHLEMTPDDVAECVSVAPGAPGANTLPPLSRYRSACDPRLNPDQAAEVVGRFADLL